MKLFTKGIYEIQCGDINGTLAARHPGAAFRKLMRVTKVTKKGWSLLARFRQKDGDKETRRWHYQEPKYLYET